MISSISLVASIVYSYWNSVYNALYMEELKISSIIFIVSLILYIFAKFLEVHNVLKLIPTSGIIFGFGLFIVYTIKSIFITSLPKRVFILSIMIMIISSFINYLMVNLLKEDK